MGLNQFKNLDSVEDFLLVLKDYVLSNEDYINDIKFINDRFIKYKNIDNYSYYDLIYTLLIKLKLISIDKMDISYSFHRKEIDMIYRICIIDNQYKFNNIIECIFMADITAAAKINSCSEDFLNIFTKYKIENFAVPFYSIIDHNLDINVLFEYKFLLSFGTLLKKIIKNKRLQDENNTEVYMRFLLACSNNISFVNDEYNYIEDIINLIFEIEGILCNTSEEFILINDLNTILKYFIANAYYSEKEAYEEDFKDNINEDYLQEVKKLNNIICKIGYDEIKLHTEIKVFFDTIKQKFIKNNSLLINLTFTYFLECYCNKYDPIDTILELKNMNLPKYKQVYLTDLIVKYCDVYDLYNKREYGLIVKKYNEGIVSKNELNSYCFEIAYAFHKFDEINKAKDLYQYNIKIGKAEISTYNNLGVIFLKQGDQINALSHFKKAHKMNPEDKKYINIINKIENEIHRNNVMIKDKILWENVNEKYIDNNLSHLKVNQIKELLKRYYNDEKVSTLIKTYNLDIKINEFYKILPPIVYNDKFCCYCKEPMITDRPSKSNASNFYNLDIRCPNCGHIFNKLCNCSSCRRLREDSKKAEEIKKRNLIRDTYCIEKLNPRKYEDLTLYEKLYLAAIARDGLEEDMTKIKPIHDFNRCVSPTDEYTSNIINLLINNNVLSPHTESAINAFVNDEDFPGNYYTYKVKYHINLISDKYSSKELLENILNPKIEDIQEDIKVYYNLWMEISLEECKQYLLYNMESVGFNFKIGNKTISMFKDLLNNFSVGQIFYIVHKGVTDATRYYQENNITKKHAANTAISNCLRYGEKVVVNEWDIRPYNRTSKLPQSLVSECFFNRFLCIAEKGFYEKPSIHFIKEHLR